MARYRAVAALLVGLVARAVGSGFAVYGGSTREPTRIGYQGEPGAYSEKALRALLGPHVSAIGFPTFEEVFKAVANHEVDYACLPVENSLGGSIHANHDLLLRYNLHIIGEHELRVEHALMALPGTRKEDVKKVYSHPQALAQTENYLLRLGAEPVPAHDTAGSARRIAQDKMQGCAAVASDLAASVYGLEILDTNIEDDDSNYTRFMLLSREPVGHTVARPRRSTDKAAAPRKVPFKTSIVFTLPNTAGALYKALACFSLRDIDFCKIESRPTSVQLLRFLKYRGRAPLADEDAGDASAAGGMGAAGRGDLPRFRYCFYLDFVGSEAEPRVRAALANLREQCPYVRVLGSYPAKSFLAGPIQEVVAGRIPTYSAEADAALQRQRRIMRPRRLKDILGADAAAAVVAQQEPPTKLKKRPPLRIGVVGYGALGRFLAQSLHSMGCVVSGLQTETIPVVTVDAAAAQETPLPEAGGLDADQADSLLRDGTVQDEGVWLFPKTAPGKFLSQDLDVVLLCVQPMDLEPVLRSLPLHMLRGKVVADTCRAKVHARETLLQLLPLDADVLCTDVMFGPWTPNARLGKWEALPFVYERVRVRNMDAVTRFVNLFEARKCNCMEMTCEEHDEMALGPMFFTHVLGAVVAQQASAVPTLINTPTFQGLLNVASQVKDQPYDDLYALYRLYGSSRQMLRDLRATLTDIEAGLAARDGYLTARRELMQNTHLKGLSEIKGLLKEVMAERGGGDGGAAPTGLAKSENEASGAAPAATGKDADPRRAQAAQGAKVNLAATLRGTSPSGTSAPRA